MSRAPYYATLPTKEIGRAILERVQRYYADTRVTEILNKQRIAYRYYLDLSLNWAGWGTPGSTNQMQRGGEEGELALIRINHARNLVGNRIATAANAQYYRRPKAASDDYDAMQAAELSTFALDDVASTQDLDIRRIERLAGACTMGEGLTLYDFDQFGGRPYAMNPATQQIEYVGAPSAQTVLSWDVTRNPYTPWAKQLDLTVRMPEELKWRYAARFPEHRESILDAPSQTIVPYFTPTSSAMSNAAPDGMELFRWYHLPCEIPELVEGRECWVLGNGTVILDRPLAIRRFPLARVSEAPDVPGAPFGYPPFWEYLGIQELYDFMQSIAATNISTHGVQNIAIKTGMDASPIKFEGGMNVWVCDDPEHDVVPKQLAKSPAEMFPHMDSLRRQMEMLSGGSTVNRGEAQGDRQPAAALALLSAETIKNASPLQKSDTLALRAESQILLRLLRHHMKRPMPISVKADGETAYERAIVAHDLGNTDDVEIELANALQQTTEGKLALLQTFAQMKLPLTPEQAFEVAISGRIEPATDYATKQGLQIRLENKQILQGIIPVGGALITDDAIRHCRDHTITMCGPARNNPKAQAAFIAHLEDHYRVFYGSDPEQDKIIGLYRPQMMAICGLTPPPPPPQGAEPLPGEPPPPLPPDAGPVDAGEPPPPLPPRGAAPQPANATAPALVAPNKAQPPRNPISGQRWTPTDGGATT